MPTTTSKTTVALTPDFLRDLSIVAEDEGLMRQAVRYIKRLAAKQQKYDPTLMTKEEFFRQVDQAKEEIRQGKCTAFTDMHEMHAWLNSL